MCIFFNTGKKHARKLRSKIRRDERFLKKIDDCIVRFESEITAAELSLKDAKKIKTEIRCEIDQFRSELAKIEESIDDM